MKKETYNLLWIIFLFVTLCIPNLVKAENNISPMWQVGTKWVVKAVYHKYLNKDEWSEPVYWEYHVSDYKEDGTEKYYIIDVKEQKNHLNLTARLTYNNNFSLVKAELAKIQRGKESIRTLTFEKSLPISTEQTLIPYDTPVFPLLSPSSADFTITKQVTKELKAKEKLRQEVCQVSDIKEIPESASKADLTEVKCTGSNGKTLFTQYWRKDIPFPIFGWNQNMKYWLVDF